MTEAHCAGCGKHRGTCSLCAPPADSSKVYGLCTACGSTEVALVKATGTRDLSAIGESATYPTGHGCEVCA